MAKEEARVAILQNFGRHREFNPTGLSFELGRTREVATMTHQDLLKHKHAEILSIASRYGARNVRVFGSVARAEADEQSDIDFLVEMEPGRSLFDLGGMQSELETALGRPVDVVTEKGLKARIRARVLQEAIPV
jgi:predicted nucleotidyltransferase